MGFNLVEGTVILYDGSGNPLAVQNGQATPVSGLLVLGSNYAGAPLAYPPRVDSAGIQFASLTTPGLAAGGVAGNTVRLGPNRSLRVMPEPSDLLRDKFDSVLDTTDKWTLATGGSGASISISGGTLVIAGGTTSAAWASLVSQATFESAANAYLNLGTLVQVESGSPNFGTGQHRFHGFGTAGSNTTTAPLSSAVGYEIATDGHLYAVIWSNGSRVFASDLTTYTPSPGNAVNDGTPHRLDVFYNAAKVEWYIDGEDKPAASKSFSAPQAQVLPIRYHVINATPFSGPASTFKLYATGVTDTGHNNHTISDGNFGWRKAKVASNGALYTAPQYSPTGTISSVAASTTVVTLLAANTNRVAATIFNDSATATLYLALAAGASTTAYTVQVRAGGYYELPVRYVGIITGVWNAPVGSARITEFI